MTAPTPTARAPRRQPRAEAPPAAPPLVIRFPEALPVSARRDEIAAAIRANPVVIVCGETGSGKTTQLPKIALSLGRGLAAGGKGVIGHTQPRRIAASSVAKRIADELQTPLGEVVGFKVRFQDRLQPGASVKLMTDGILLAETQSDPLLRAYDTIIIDEAHERSLNIDFLLGYLRQILPRRPDLKIIVTSATIDADRFARHFAGAQGPAPVIQVSGRLYPVEQRWRPFEESREYGLNDAIADAVDELWRGTAEHRGEVGDVLVFLPGEREIRDAADHLRRHLAQAAHKPGTRLPHADVLPLFARLSQAEQDQVFEPHGTPRIVLATNVAETSLTVPGIRYVVDAGTARVKRYSYRNKVEQLLVEPISQAAANQRAGRCGRVADGVCVRLYDETDFGKRTRFTDPEIMRSSLAGVILRMKSLGLGLVEDFPFIEPPPKRAIADGYQLLAELGAVDEFNEITPLGQALARLPLDPRVGRMILAAHERHALTEVLVIASAMSVQDVRDRPIEHQAAADQAHKAFDDEKSEFMGDLKLWRWLEGLRAPGHGEAAGNSAPARQQGATHKLSHRQQEQALREKFLSPRRVREWRDIHAQLHTVVAEQGWRLNTTPATYEQVHLSLLAGLLGNIGCKADPGSAPAGTAAGAKRGQEDEGYLGARGIRFWPHPGANLSKKPGRWIMAAELVETSRLYGRNLAAIEPQWLPGIAGHVIKTQLLEPHWEKKAGEVVALERATLYGLVVYSNRRVNFGLVDPKTAREVMIREALVGGQTNEMMDTRLPFIAANRKLIREVEELEHKSRRQDVLVDDELIAGFYDRLLPADVVSAATLEAWWRGVAKQEPRRLHLTRDELMRHEAAGITTATFPKLVRLGGVDCAATYLHEPGDPRDGVTVTVPIFALNPVSDDRCDWLVPGMLVDKVHALVKSLHQRPRSRLVPLPEFAKTFAETTPFGNGNLLDVLLKAVRDKTQLDVKRADFKQEQVPVHLLMNFRIVDEHGRQLAMGRNLASLKAELGGEARSAFQALATLRSTAPASLAAEAAGTTRRDTAAAGADRPNPGTPPAAKTTPAADAAARYTHWSFGELPELLEVRRGAQSLIGFPALIDRADHVQIEVFDEPDVAATKHRAGLQRLVALQLKDMLKVLGKQLPELQAMSMAYLALGGTPEELRDQILDRAIDRAFLAAPLPTDAAGFDRCLAQGRGRLTLVAQEVARGAAAVLAEHVAAQRKLKDAKPPKPVADDITAQMARLVGKRLVLDTPWERMAHLPRYLKGVSLRLEKLRADPLRDADRMAEFKPLEQRWLRAVADRRGVADERLDEFRWLLEELRISLFAQELRTPQPVSVKRLDKVWAQGQL